MAYPATSLDFINRPNPVEPHTVPERHPLDDGPRLEKPTHQDLLRLLINTDANSGTHRPSKRQKSEDVTLDLPKLPAVRNGTKRLRIPPTLSGLHQPPPDAGLLPSMLIDQPLKLARTARSTDSEVIAESKSVSAPTTASVKPPPEATTTGDSLNPRLSSKSKRKKWSDEETAYLLKGVAKFGIGNWTLILNCAEYDFGGRTAIDLKDRFRVCCPDHYKTNRKPKKSNPPSTRNIPNDDALIETPTVPSASRTDRKSSIELLELGINEPFEQSKRRKRTTYSAAEDEALMKGFEKHGNAWAAIRQDEEFGLLKRTATDLRDRFRTKYPERYEKAGLAPRPEVFPPKPNRQNKQESNDHFDSEVNEASKVETVSETYTKIPDIRKPEGENKVPQPPQSTKKQPVTSLLQYDDVFWGAPALDDDDSGRITLDRRILDWPSDVTRMPSSNEHNAKTTIDPLATLNLPKPPVNISYAGTSAMQTFGFGSALPSLATITASSDNIIDQLELPSLMGAFGNLDGDGKHAAHLQNLDELWR